MRGEGMSLRTFHIVFVTLAEILVLLFARWALQAGADPADRWMGVVALVAATVMAVYGVWVYRKLRQVGEAA